jgi:hypothetical protein
MSHVASQAVNFSWIASHGNEVGNVYDVDVAMFSSSTFSFGCLLFCSLVCRLSAERHMWMATIDSKVAYASL